jgi:hypothetical protein
VVKVVRSEDPACLKVALYPFAQGIDLGKYVVRGVLMQSNHVVKKVNSKRCASLVVGPPNSYKEKLGMNKIEGRIEKVCR